MTTTTIKLAPPNSLIFVSGLDGGVMPDPEDIAQVAGIVATESCIAVCCLAEMDGVTEFTMGPACEVGSNSKPAFDGTLATPSRAVVVSTVEWRRLMEADVPTDETRLRIWTNRRSEPDRVIIGLG